MNKMFFESFKAIRGILLFFVIILLLLWLVLSPKQNVNKEYAVNNLSNVLISDSNQDVRRISANSLGKIGDDSAVDGLIKAYQKDDINIDDIISSLGKLGISPTQIDQQDNKSTTITEIDKYVIAPLRGRLNQINLLRFLSNSAVYILVALFTVAVPTAIYDLRVRKLSWRDAILRQAQRISIGFVLLFTISTILYTIVVNTSSPEIKPVLVVDEGLRIDLAKNTKDPQSVISLIDVVSDVTKAPKLRAKAAEALGAIGDNRAIVPLSKLLNDSDAGVRMYSAWALGNILAAKPEDRENEFSRKHFDEELAKRLTDYIEIKPNSGAVYLLRGRTYISLGRYSDALPDFDKALFLTPMLSAEILTERGYVYALTSRSKEAIADYNRAIDQDSNFVLAYFRRGLSYSAANDEGNAVADFSKVISLDPNNAEAYSLRAYNHEILNDPAAAISDYQTYIQLNPTAIDRTEIEMRIKRLTSAVK